jgi:hypothetical protein
MEYVNENSIAIEEASAFLSHGKMPIASFVQLAANAALPLRRIIAKHDDVPYHAIAIRRLTHSAARLQHTMTVTFLRASHRAI